MSRNRVTVQVDRGLYDRIKLVAEIRNEPTKNVIHEALEYWTDICGAAEIYTNTGVETGPEETLKITPNNHYSSVISITSIDNIIPSAPQMDVGLC